MIRTYSEMLTLPTLEERYHYLALRGSVGRTTFGHERWLNQGFYTSREWRQLRHHIIARDAGCDLGIQGYDIFDNLFIHHMNPIKPSDIYEGNEDIVDPEFLVTVAFSTHNAIHYGNDRHLPRQVVERKPGDTTLWSKGST